MSGPYTFTKHFLVVFSFINMFGAPSLYFFGFLLILSAVSSADVETTTRVQITDTAIESTLNDRRYLMRQLKCALGEAPCDPVGRKLKSLAPLVLRGTCPQCTPQEMRQIQKVLAFVQKNYPKEWNKILQQYAG